jgi:hypothetical protein
MTPVDQMRQDIEMTATQIRIRIPLIGILFIILSLSACVFSSQPESKPAAAANTAVLNPVTFPPKWTPTSTISPTPTNSPAPTITSTSNPTKVSVSPSGTKAAREAPVIEDWEALDSFRVRIGMRMEIEPDSGFMDWRVTYERVKEPPAMHQVITIGSLGAAKNWTSMTMEVIQIGNAVWTKIEGKWAKTEYSYIPTQKAIGEGMERNFQDLRPVGEETINTIRCIRYMVDEDILQTAGNGSQNMTTHVHGDLWAANQPDLPSVVIRMRVEMRTSGTLSLMPTTTLVRTPMVSEQQLIYLWDFDMTDINVPIVIKPPADFDNS